MHRTLLAVRALGAEVTEVTEDDGTVRVIGGRRRLHAASSPLDLGNSGTGLRLLAGVLAGLEGTTALTGDASLTSRPMDRVAEPLERMGATVAGRGERLLPPVEITGGSLRAIDYRPPMASAQVKSAVLLGRDRGRGRDGRPGAGADPDPHRGHAGRGRGDDLSGRGGGERVVRVRRSELRSGRTAVPGDPSQAAFWVVAGLIVPGSSVTIPSVYLGPQRAGFLGVLGRMGAGIEVLERSGDTGTIVSRTTMLCGTEVRAEEIPSLDEVPILAVAAATAEGQSRFRDVGELRVKESDRLVGTVAMLRALGAEADVDGDDLVVAGGARFRAGRFDSARDHRMAMAAAVAGLSCRSSSDVTTIIGWSSVGTSYPRFSIDMSTLSEPRGSGG